VTTFTETVSFIQGQGSTISSLHAKNSSNANVSLIVSGSLGQTSSAQVLKILAGPSRSIKVLSDSNGAGTDKSVATVFAVASPTNTTFYVTGYDQFSNYSGPVVASITNVTFDGGAPTAGMEPFTFVPSANVVAFDINPRRSGSGVFSVTPNDTNITPLTTQTMTVTSGGAIKYRLKVGAWNSGTTTCDTYATNTVVAGADFCIRVDALDTVNAIVPDYGGTGGTDMNLMFTSSTQDSWAGDTPTLPNDHVVCRFTSGICQMQGPFKLVKSSSVAILNVYDRDEIVVDPEQGSVFGTNISINAGTATRLVIADKMGGPAAGAIPLKTVATITADEYLDVAAALVDNGGNFISNAPNTVVWSGTSATAGVFDAANFGPVPPGTANNPKRFTPVKTGTGTIDVSLTDGGTTYTTAHTGSFQIKHGALHHVLTTTQHQATTGVEEVGKCFSFTATLVDQDENAITSYSAVNNVNFQIFGAVTGTPTRYLEPFFCPAVSASACQGDTAFPSAYQTTGTSSRLKTSTDPMSWPSRSILNGVIPTGDILVCLWDATDVTPQIEVQMPALVVPDVGLNFPAFTGRGAVIAVDQTLTAHHVHPASANSASNPGLLCERDKGNACTAFTAGSTPAVIYGRLHDSGCNDMGEAAGSWQVSGSSLIYNDVITPGANDPLNGNVPYSGPANSVKLNLIKSSIPSNAPAAGITGSICENWGCTTLSFNANGTQGITGTLASNWGIRVSPGAIVDYDVIVNNGQAVYADTKFSVDVRLKDANNNTAGIVYSGSPSTFTAYNLAFSFNGTATNSPKGTAPLLLPAANRSFPVGVFESGNNDFQIPNASNTPVLTVTPTLGPVSLNPKNIPITVNVGGLTSSKLLNDSCLSNAGATVVTDLAQSISTNQTLTVHHMGFDSELNCKGGVNATFTATNESPAGVLSGQVWNGSAMQTIIYPTSGTTFTITPDEIGNGKVLVDPTPSFLPNLSTGVISIGYGTFAGFDVDSSSGGGTEAAGVPFDIIVRATDVRGNTVANFTGQKALSFSIQYDYYNPALILYNAENNAHALPANGNYNFVNGIATISSAILYNSLSTPSIRVIHTTGGVNYDGSHWVSTVNPGVAHHIGVNSISDNAQPNVQSNWGNTFNARFELRDIWGNMVPDPNNVESAVAISIEKISGGTWNLGTLKRNGGAAGTIDLRDGFEDVTGLAYDVAGQHKLKATGTNFSSTTTASSTINFIPNRKTVANYEIVPSGSATAGINQFFTVKAKDNAGNVVDHTDTTSDTELTSLTFAWTGANNAPLGNAPYLPTSLNFTNGQASFWGTLYKAETIGSLTVTDNMSTWGSGFSAGNRTGTYSNYVVSAGNLNRYKIQSSQSSRLADSTSTFTVTVSAFDAYENSRAGDTNLQLVPVYASGTQTNIGWFQPASYAQNLNTSSGSVTTSAIYYNVGHAITLSLSGMSGGVTITQTPTISFTPTQKTIASYSLVPSSTSITAGSNNLTTTILARDAGWNIITQLDSVLNGQSYSWSGVSNSPVPSNIPPVYGTVSSWSSGQATATHSFKRAETMTTSGLRITDNHSPTRTGYLNQNVLVNPSTTTSYTLSSATSTTVSAGVGVNINVAAYDAYSNQNTLATSDTLTFSWSGTTASPATPNSAGGVTAAVLAPGSRSFSSGLFTSSGTPFILYRTGETPVLNMTSGSVAGSWNLSGWTVNPNSTVDYVKILAGSAAGSAEVNAYTMNTDQTYTIYSHAFDAWGNRIGAGNANWTATSVLNGRMGPVTNVSSIIVDPNVNGTSVITATPSVGTADSTGTFTINPGAITKITSSTASFSQTADNKTAIQLTVRDAEDNAATDASNQTITLAATNSGVFYTYTGTYPSGSCSTSTITTISLTAGQSTVAFCFGKTAVGSSSLTFSKSPWTQATATATVTVGAITKTVIYSSAINTTATGCGAISFKVQDQNSNDALLLANTNFSLSSNSATGAAFYANNTDCTNQASAITSTTVNTGSAGATVYFRDNTSGGPTVTISENPAASPNWTDATQAQSFNPGTFSITTPAASAEYNGMFTVVWGASTGTTGYDIKTGTNNTCSTGAANVASVSAGTTSQLLTSLTANSNNYVCVTAKGNNSKTLNASNYGVAFLYDTSLPTITFSPAVATYYGPNSTPGANHSFTGTAADTTSPNSGLNLVEFSLQQNGGSCWNGTAFAAACPNYMANTSGTAASWTFTIPDSAFTHNTVYTFSARSKDDAGNYSTLATQSFTWDNVVPSVNVGSDILTNAGTTSTVTTTNSDSLAGIASYAWSHVSGPATASFGSGTAANSNITTTTDGAYVVRLTVTDNAGNTNFDELTVTKDTVAPSAFAIGTITNNNTTTPTISWTNNADAASYRVVVNDNNDCTTTVLETINSIASNATSQVLGARASDSLNYVCVFALDLAGNSRQATSAPLSFIIDMTNPTISFSPAAYFGPNTTAGVNTTFSGTAADMPANNTGVASVEVSLQKSGSGCWNGTDFTGACPTYTNATGTTSWSWTIADSAFTHGSAYIFSVRSKDNVNRYSTATTPTITWDNVAPTGSIPATTYSKISPSATITSSISDALSGMGTYSWSSAAGATVTFGSQTAANTTVINGSDGTTTIRLRGTDAAGNFADFDGTFIKDNTAPSAFSITSVTNQNTTTPTVNWGASSGQASYTVIVNDNSDCTTTVLETISGISSGATSQVLGARTAGSTYYVCVKAIDLATNEQTASNAAYAFKVDTTAPTVSFSPASYLGPQSTVGTNTTFSGTSSDTGGGTVASVEFSIQAGGGSCWGGASFNQACPYYLAASGTTSWSYTSGTAIDASLVNGTVYNFSVRATDSVGNVGSATTASMTWDSAAPTSVNAGSDATTTGVYTVNSASAASDSGAGGITYAWSSATASFTNGTTLTPSITPSSEGANTITLTATDAVGNSATDTMTLTRDTTPPNTFAIGAVTNNTTTTPTIAWTNNGDAASYTVIVNDDADCTTTPLQNITGISSVSTSQQMSAITTDGKYYVCVMALDAMSNSRTATSAPLAFEVETSTIHIVYSKTVSGVNKVVYNKRVGTTWQASDELLSTSDNISTRTSLALSSANNAAVGYSVFTGAASWDVKTRTYNGSSWDAASTVFSSVGSAGTGLEIAFDESNTLASIFSGREANSPYDDYLTASGTAIGSGQAQNSILDAALAFDDGGTNREHVIYTLDGANKSLKYAHNTSGSWGTTADAITNASCTGMMYASMYMNGTNNYPVIAYICLRASPSDRCDVYHARYNGTTWTHTVVDTIKSTGCTNSTFTELHRPVITKVSSDNAVIAYFDGDDNSAKAAHVAGTTVTGPSSVATSVTGDVTVATDASNRVYVFYRVAGVLYMKHNNNNVSSSMTGTTWSTAETVEAADVSGVGNAAANGMEGRSNRP